jgi:hypothetical protein
MQKNGGDRDYIEWDDDACVPPTREAENASIASMFDAEIRRRIGEVIARAADGEKTGRGPKRH